MLDSIVNASQIDVMQRALQAANLRQEVISNNIANINTPRFKRSTVAFEEMLAKELGYEDDPNQLKVIRTHDKHLPVALQGKAVPAAKVDESDIMRVDDNNVDIDREMAGMAKNQIMFNALARTLGGHISRLKTVISSK